FLYRARRGAESAHVVVVNHALLLSDLGTDGGILPPYRHLIIDEAHGLEAEATRQLGFEVDAPRLALHLDALGRAEGTRGEGRRARGEEARGGSGDPLGELRARLNVTKGKAAREAGSRVGEAAAQARAAVATAREAGVAFFARLAAFVARHGGEGGGYDQRLRLIDDLRAADDWREVEVAWDGLHAPLLTIGEALTATLLALDAVGEELEGREDIIMELTLALRANAEIRLHAGAAVARPDPGMVYWIEAGGGGGGGAGRIGLHAAPLHVGQALREGLFGPKRSTVLTSATLATEGSFAFVRERLGLADNEAVRELRVPSPFDYARNVLLLLPDDIPEPGAPNHQKGLNEALIRLCAATEGRALVLFTSYNALQTTYRAIKAPLERAGVLVLGQRIDGGPRQILDRFRSNPGTVLLGTSSFWEGVDVVGDALSTLVITRLPFAVPTDPVFAARSEGFADPF
ncbi:MAG: DinG family ATP-dependent helicase YoaA, partial [uncultured Thermomicrobiales bacterium]